MNKKVTDIQVCLFGKDQFIAIHRSKPIVRTNNDNCLNYYDLTYERAEWLHSFIDNPSWDFSINFNSGWVLFERRRNL